MNFQQPKLSFKQQQQEREEDVQGKSGERKHSGKSVGFIGCRAARQSNSTAEQGALHTVPKTPGIAAWLLRSLSQRQGAARLRSRAGKRSRSREKEPEPEKGAGAGSSYLCPLPAEVHQHRRSLVDLAAVEHPAASQHHRHPLGHGPSGAARFPGEPHAAVSSARCPQLFIAAALPQQQVGPGGLGRVFCWHGGFISHSTGRACKYYLFPQLAAPLQIFFPARCLQSSPS